MSADTDVYADWDAAYVLGALSARERHAFEQHLAVCPRCASAVREVAGMPGLLARVPAAELLAADAATDPHVASDARATPAIASVPRQHRARRSLLTACLTAAAAAVIVVISIGGLGAGSTAPASAETVRLVSTGQTALSADVRLDPEDWGTAVSTHCRYGAASTDGGRYGGEAPDSEPTAASGVAGSHRYGLYVTDREGMARLVSSWSAAPGSDVRADGSTDVPIEQIALVDIRAIDTGDVMLQSPVPAVG